ncbi:MAG: 6-carboxytetrahydropterin synthase [Deltaproteobacteria bacterium]|jgi:6-pyruvoyltetrahydropterin/6-carboxytetrahydropterin synthase|nr:6-carboxytetrahydropterin synthase [Deltaproteobacteria bacterium]
MIIESSIEFSCAHFYHQPSWTFKENAIQFGKCFSPWGHGHNYKLIVSYKIDTSIHLSLDDIEDTLNSQIHKIKEILDHRHLNFDIPEFKKTIPTTENISLYILNNLEKLPWAQVNQVVLKELDSLWVELRL